CYVWMEQQYKGLHVYGGGVRFSIHAPTGNLVKFGTLDLVSDPNVDVSPAITPEDAMNIARQSITGFKIVYPEGPGTLQGLSTRAGSARAVSSVTIRSGFADEPGRFLVHVDARTGHVLRTDNLIHEVNVTGNVSARVRTFDPTSPLVTLPLRDMGVN